MNEAERIEAAILALEAQRAQLGDAVVALAVAPLRARLAAIEDEAPRATQRIRLVSVLFADIVDSTRLTDALDAEDYAALLSEALLRFRRAVESHRGRVTRFTGDGLKALFGADGEQGDAAECAVRAGLAMLHEAKGYARELEARGHGALQLRVGINTGEAALGGGAEAENTATGSMVGVAARIEQAAEPGTLLIGADTHIHVRGLFDVAPREPLRAKGIAEPISTFVVHAARSRALAARRGIDGVETPLIGREPQLAQLVAAFDVVAATGRMQALTLIGEAGTGKSRLLRELRQRLDRRASGLALLAGSAPPQGRLQPYGLLRDLLASRFQIADGDPAELARRKLIDGLAPALDEGEAARLGQLIGLDFSAHPAVRDLKADARLLRDRAFDASVRWLQSHATPVLLLEDLHWADDGSLEWLRHLLRTQQDRTLLLLLTARGELLDRQPAWTEQAAGQHRRLDLEPLDEAASVALVEALLARLVEIPASLRDMVTGGAEGNPFYMEELVKMLIDEGVIAVDADADAGIAGAAAGAASRWRIVADRPLPARVPPTLTGVLQARLDALPERDRSALQQSSVIGAVFWEQALAALDPAAPPSLALLVQRQLVRRHAQSAFDDSNELAFGHHLLHQVTYDTVLKSVRRAAHAAAAAWLAERINERSGEYLAVTAEHFERAGDRASAADYFARAAHDAESRFANDVAIDNARRALANIGSGDAAARFPLLRFIDRILDGLGRRAEQLLLHDEMEVLAPPGEMSVNRSVLLMCRSLLADRHGDFPAARAHAMAAIAVAEPVGAWVTAALAHGEVAYIAANLGDRTLARESAAQAVERARRSDDVLSIAQMLAIGAYVEEADANHAEAAGLLREGIALARQYDLTRLEGLLQGNIAGTLQNLGDFAAARAHQLEGMRIMNALGNRRGEAASWCTLSTLDLLAGDAGGALDKARQAVGITTALNDRYFGAQAHLVLGDAHVATGNDAAARASFDESRTLYRAATLVAGGWQAAARLAELALARGDVGAAMGQLADLVDAPEDGDLLRGAIDPQRIRLACHRVLAASGDRTRAGRWLAAAHAELQAQAARVPEPSMRERFLHGIARHRDIQAAWEAWR